MRYNEILYRGRRKRYEICDKKNVRKLHHLPEVKLREVLDFVELLTVKTEHSTSQRVADNVRSQENE